MSNNRSPILDTFDWLREALARFLGVHQSSIRPDTDLASLIPVSERRRLWRQLREEGLARQDLVLSARTASLLFFFVLLLTGALAIWLKTWFALMLLWPIGTLCYWISRPRATHFPIDIRTAGELAVFLTHFGAHHDAGYRWTAEEISVKVRMIVADWVGLPLDEVRRETVLTDIVD